MSFLLPQFKCVPDTFSFHFKKPTTLISKSRELICFRTRCSVSTVSPPASTSTTTRLDLEKLRLLSVEARANSASTERPWMYIDAFDSLKEANLGTNLPTETLLTIEEATIATAAAEALALAKAALKVAKDAAKLMGSTNLYENSANLSTKSDTMLNDKAQRTQIGKFGFNDNLPLDNPISEADEALALAKAALRVSKDAAKLMDSTNSDNKSVNLSIESDTSTEIGKFGFKDNFLLKPPISRTDDLDPTSEELELLEAQLTSGEAVKSNRQIERKARRMRAAEKAAANVVSVKSGSTSRKKRVAFQEIDRSDPLRYLRATTGSSRLLTATEEQEFSLGIQDLLKLERLQEELTERCGCEPTFAQWAAAAGVDQKVLRERLSYGTLCKDKMIKSNIRLVISIAKNYQGSGMNLQDLIQEGCRGLVRGAEKFDASKGFKFSTYAHWWIKQAVRRSLSDQSRTIRLPFHIVEATYRVKEARKQLLSENGRQPNDEEIAEATGLSMKRLQAVLLAPKPPRSLDQKVGINQDLKPSEVTADPEAETSEEILIKQLMKKDLEKVLDSLNPREKQVIRWRFGLDDGRMKTLQEIGELMGVSRERVRQIESCAFRKLKNKRKTKHLQQYLVA